MNVESVWPWAAMALLGAWHGVNPGMGWLFAAALGMQEGRGSAAWRALPPLALGHALAVGATLAAALALGLAFSPTTLRLAIGGVLIAYGLFRFVRAAHPRYGGMRVGARDLTIWSFLMASAHGAGLMVLPFVTGVLGRTGAAGETANGAIAAGPHVHHLHAPAVDAGGAIGPLAASVGAPEGWEAAAAVLLHTGAYLLVTGALAVLVVRWLGLRLLRSLWVDLDRIWAATLVATGVLTLVL